MGLQERTKSNGNFLSVKHGGLCLEHKPTSETTEAEIAQWEADGYVQREIDNPSDVKPDGSLGTVTKWIRKFAGLDGKIVKIEWYDREDGGARYVGIKLHVRDGGDFFQVDLPYGKPHFDYFTKVMENIDFERPVEINAWPDKAKPRQTVFVIKQGGDYVQWRYTRDNMGDCPPAVQSPVTKKWSFEDQKEWLARKLMEEIIPKVDALNASDEPLAEYDTEEQFSGPEETPARTYEKVPGVDPKPKVVIPF